MLRFGAPTTLLLAMVATNMLRRRYHLIVPVLLAALTFALAISAFPPPPMIHDAYAYEAAAYRLVEDGVYAYGPGPDEAEVSPNARVTPGQILLLAASIAATGDHTGFADAARDSHLVWEGAEFVFALLTVLFLALSGAELGGRRLGLIAGIAGALYLPFGWAATVALAENIGTMLFAAVLWLALRFASPRRARTWQGALMLGAVAALAALARPALIAWIAAPLLYVVLARLESPRRWALLAAAAAVGFSLVFAPWWARNAVELHQFVPVRSDRVLVAGGGYETIGSEAPPEVGTRERFTLMGAILTQPWLPQYDVLWDDHYHWDEVRVDFGEYPETLLAGFLSWQRTIAVYQTFVVLLGAVGLVLFVRRSPRMLLVASVPAYVIAVHFSTQLSDRYFFPAMPAVLLLGAASGYAIWLRVLKRARSTVPAA